MTVVPGDAELLRALHSALEPERVSTDLANRLAYARDASPLALKAAAGGHSPYLARAVVWPQTTSEVQAVVRAAGTMGVALTPYGGGSGIVGAGLADPDGIIVDMKRLDRIRAIDPISMTATVEAGILGAVLEDRLNAQGLTCGHVPQSMNSSTLGGWIAHRGAGAFSTKYGTVQDLVLSVEVVLPSAELVQTRTVPASAAGPDLAALFVGAEGALGIVTAATVQVFPMPAARVHRAFAIDSFGAGLEAVRRIVQRGLRPAVVRLYDPVEASDRFAGSVSPGSSVLLLVAEGDPVLTGLTISEAEVEVRGLGGIELGSAVGEAWLAERTSTAGLCRVLATPAGIADALEVANVWSRLAATYDRMMAAMGDVIGPAGRVYGHGSHFYHSGGNLYLIFEVQADQPTDVARVYHDVLAAAFNACLAEGGTLTHHHGVGRTKQEWLAREWGPGGVGLWRAVRTAIDPEGRMNPGTMRA